MTVSIWGWLSVVALAGSMAFAMWIFENGEGEYWRGYWDGYRYGCGDVPEENIEPSSEAAHTNE